MSTFSYGKPIEDHKQHIREHYSDTQIVNLLKEIDRRLDIIANHGDTVDNADFLEDYRTFLTEVYETRTLKAYA